LPRRGELAVRVAAVPEDFRPHLKLVAGEGVLVQWGTPGSRAEAGELQPGSSSSRLKTVFGGGPRPGWRIDPEIVTTLKAWTAEVRGGR
jgi:hypothetical protein